MTHPQSHSVSPAFPQPPLLPMAFGPHDSGDIAPPQDPSLDHNNAYDSVITRGPAQIFERLAEPLNQHIYGPLTEKNRMLGMVVANLTLTTPRALEPVVGQYYIDKLRAGKRGRAFAALLGKTFLKLTDGLDGPVTRANGITSLAGAGHDAFVDMIGTRDDGKRIKEAHRHLGTADPVTEVIIDTRLGLDYVTIATGGMLNPAAAMYAQSRGAEVANRDKPKANAEAKAKFALSAAGDAVLLAGTLFKKPETQRSFKRVGTALLVGSIAAGVVSNIKYVRSARRNLRHAQATRTEATQPDTLTETDQSL